MRLRQALIEQSPSLALQRAAADEIAALDAMILKQREMLEQAVTPAGVPTGWVPYQTDAKRWRLKLCHDVRTFDGREAFGIRPNGDSCGPFKDHEVEFIRISRSQHGVEWEDPRPDRNGGTT